MGNGGEPSPLIPSIILGAFGLFKYGPSIVSYLGYSLSVRTMTFYMCALAIVLLALMLLLQETNRLYRQHYLQIQQRLSSGPVVDVIMLGVLLLVVVFIVKYNNLV